MATKDIRGLIAHATPVYTNLHHSILQHSPLLHYSTLAVILAATLPIILLKTRSPENVALFFHMCTAVYTHSKVWGTSSDIIRLDSRVSHIRFNSGCATAIACLESSEIQRHVAGIYLTNKNSGRRQTATKLASGATRKNVIPRMHQSHSVRQY